jgi:hypothetical protein
MICFTPIPLSRVPVLLSLLLLKSFLPFGAFDGNRHLIGPCSNIKIRLCPHGGKQVEGEHFWETYAPVTNWRTVRLVLILSLLADLKSQQIDNVNAFTQALADCDIFMSLPAGFSVIDGVLQFTSSSSRRVSSDHILCIKKNIYGLRLAGNNWFDALRSSLQALGFSPESA